MKFCSECQRCYDDSIKNCESGDHGSLAFVKKGETTLVEGYEIDSLIESGSPVEIYKATHLATKKNVLIRIIKAGDARSGLREQLKSFAKVEHENLVRIYECGQLPSRDTYIVSEYEDGQKLKEYLGNNKKLTEKQAIEIALQMAVGLEKIHDAGLLHRYLNPQNVFIKRTENGEFKVKLNYPDFCGIIEKKVIKEASSINARTDIFEYYSPEQHAQKSLDFKSDLYSLAIVFYEMLLGRTPYKLLSPQSIQGFVFNEDDTDRLNHNLRSLIAYTLREGLHQRLELRPRSTNNLVRQFRHLQLVATPSDLIETDDEVEIVQPLQDTELSDREKVIAALRFGNYEQETSEKDTNRSESVAQENIYSDEFSENNAHKEPTHLGVIDELGEVTEDKSVYVPLGQRISKHTEPQAKSNSFTFKKSHVYIAGALCSILFGSFFLITFYGWKSNANTSASAIPQFEKNTESQSNQQKINESENNKTQINDSIINLKARENFIENRSETKNKIAKKSAKKARKLKTADKKQTAEGKTKKSKKNLQPEQKADKKLFEDKVIIVGKQNRNSNQTGKANSKDTKKQKKVFSDVIITY